MTMRSYITSQFRLPRGLLGRLAGWVMANRPSNRQRNVWAVDLLTPQPGEFIVEIGCGPGLSLKSVASRVGPAGRVLGIDHSEVMVDAARRRNANSIAQGLVDVKRGGLTGLTPLNSTVDGMICVNVIQFLGEYPAVLGVFFKALKPGGRIAIAYQPRHRGAVRADALKTAHEIEAALSSVAFKEIRLHELDLKPVPCICVTANKPAE